MDIETEVIKPEVVCDTISPQHQPTKKFLYKRKRHFSAGRGGGGKHHVYYPPHKKAKPDVSSTRAANNIMKFRLGGSVSDPLNLEGCDNLDKEECSTCAPSPESPTNKELEPPPPLPPELQKDPLNLEGKVKNFPLLGGAKGNGKTGLADGQRRKLRRRTISGSKTEDHMSNTKVKSNSKGKQFRYGNYNRYYGYRNGGVDQIDPRLILLRKEWFEGRDCLDIGCNTGQVTIKIAKEMCPNYMVGMDIDQRLVKMAWKNLYRNYIPNNASDGRPFPSSLTLTRGPLNFPPLATTSSVGSSQSSLTMESGQLNRGCIFPHNVNFMHGNYVPKDAHSVDSQTEEYDVILALSLTKWIHLNWGDVGIKRFFQKVYRHLRPGGRFILEPQPFSSYSKRKKLTEEIFKNYQNMSFHPVNFHGYLLSTEVGFSSHKFLGVADNKSKGFQRPLHMYIKGMTKEIIPTPLPRPILSSTSSDLPSEGTERLKSVVVMMSGPHKSPRGTLTHDKLMEEDNQQHDTV